MGREHRTAYEERLLLDMDYAPGGAIVYFGDGDEEFLHVNQYVLDLMECNTIEEFLEYTQGTFRGFVFEDDYEVTDWEIRSQIEQRHMLGHLYYRVMTKSGRLVVIDDYGRFSTSKRDGRPVYHAFVVEMADGGAMDWLTGLPGMARFRDIAREAEKAMRLRGEQPVAVALDLTGMKGFNSQYGREKGTKLIRACAKAIEHQFGREACSRFAEDHFYAITPKDGVENRIVDLFDELKSSQPDVTLPLRVGLYECAETDDIVAVGLDRAKFACDYDRTSWQSHFTWFTDQMRDAMHFRMRILNNLDRAIDEEWVRPHYQAILRSSSGSVCCEEALARWMDPEYGEFAPSVFLPVLEEAGVLQRLDMYMVECVLRDIVARKERGMPVLPVSINISLRGLQRLDIAKELSERCDAQGVDHSYLRVEFTESTASFDPQHLKSQISNLHAAGFEVWMDDFGSGHSSLNIIQEFDFDLIKLDMGFFDYGRTERSRTLIESVVQLVGRLQLKTLAEGVEDTRQAEFLERVGCDMLQGYFFMPPLSLEAIAEAIRDHGEVTFELPEDHAYWDAVSLLDLNELTPYDNSEHINTTPVSRMPVAVVERRDDDWYVLRANEAYRENLDNAWSASGFDSGMGVRPMRPRPKKGFRLAAKRSEGSGSWEYVSDDLGFGLAYHFYVRPFMTSNQKHSYMLVGAPSMLGAALGSYGDVPVAYAIFRASFGDDGATIAAMEYVYANRMYYRWLGLERGTLTGKSFTTSVKNASTLWLPYCYEAIVSKRSVHDVVFSPEIGHWVSFNLVPSPVENCCVYAFTIVDDEHREREEIIAGRETSDRIIDIVDALSGELSYDAAMNNMLKHLSRVIHPDRLYVYECDEHTVGNVFEWCAPGMAPLLGSMYDPAQCPFANLKQILKSDSIVLIPDVSDVKDLDECFYKRLVENGITHMLLVPFYFDGTLLGYLGAENYQLDESLDMRRLLETVASFVSSRIANRQLLERLEWVSRHDALTGLLNRWGIDHVIQEYMRSHANQPYVLALMDVDDFKTVNDVYGHDVGDAALRELASVVTEAFPEGTILGRNGGDEFLAMMFGENTGNIEEILEDIVSRELGCTFNGKWYPLSMSIGYACYPEQAVDLASAYSYADAALYSVKLGGKSGYRAYEPHINVQHRSQLAFTPRSIADNVPGAILVHRPGDGEILFANDDAIKLFECDDFEDFMTYVGGTFGGVIHPDDRTRVRDDLARQTGLGQSGVTDYVDFRIVTKKGNVRQVFNNGRGVHEESVGEVYYELLIVRDGHSLT